MFVRPYIIHELFITDSDGDGDGSSGSGNRRHLTEDIRVGIRTGTTYFYFLFVSHQRRGPIIDHSVDSTCVYYF